MERDNAREHLAFGRGVHSCPGGPLARLETRVSIERLLDRTTNISISEEHHGPPDARRYNYMPTYILRGAGPGSTSTWRPRRRRCMMPGQPGTAQQRSVR